MFSVPKRIKDALDRTLAEEQARHKAFNERQAASARDAGTFPTQDIDKQPALAGLPNPDPAVYEAVFQLEDDPPSRSSTPKQAASGADAKGGADKLDSGKNDSSDGHNGNGSTDKAEGTDTSTKPDAPALPPRVQARLKKLEKLEATYPELLRSYRIAHSRIDPFERALREHTPLSSIKDPAAFVEYLNQMNQNNGLMREELKTISTEKDLFKRKSETFEKELAALRNEISALETAQAEKDVTNTDDDKGDEGEDARDHEIKSLKDLLEQRSKKIEDLETDAKKERSLHSSTLEEKDAEIEKLQALNKEASAARDQLSSAELEYKKRLAELELQLKPNETMTPMSRKDRRKKGKMVESPLSSPFESPQTEALKTEVSKLKAEIAEKDSQIDKLTEQRKKDELNREEAETLKESLTALGGDLVEKSDELKESKNENAKLKSTTKALEAEIKSLEAEVETLKSSESNLAADQKVSQERFKEITANREVITKMQAEIKSLRLDSEALKTTREELMSKQNEIRALEKREKELKSEIARLKRQCSEYESEIKSLKNQVSTANTLNAKLEDEKRRLGRDSRRLEQEKADIKSGSEKTNRELEAARTELSSLRPKVKKLEDEAAQLQKEKNHAKEDVDLKTQQYENAQKLIASMRDEALELATQLKEAIVQVESSEEERIEVQKHLAERTREGETMRRMLADANHQADAEVRDMRSRMETAIEERDQFEDKYSTLARQRSREMEEFRNTVHELEGEVKRLTNDKHDLETRGREFGQQRAELERSEENALAEAQELRSTVANLRFALDASEQEARDMERQLADSKKLLEEANGRYEKMKKDAKEDTKKDAKEALDYEYLRDFLLNLFKVDAKRRLNMIPPLKRLLRFSDEQEALIIKYLQGWK